MHTASRNQRSWVTTTSALPAARQVLGQPVDALDVEVVGRLVEHQQVVVADQQRRPAPPGGARRRTAGRARRRARAGADARARPARRGPRVAGPLVRRRRSRQHGSRTVARRAAAVVLRQRGEPQPAGRRDAAAVRVARVPASSRSSVVLPPPLRPTTPIRSPSRRPSETAVEQRRPVTRAAVRLADAPPRLTRLRRRQASSGDCAGGPGRRRPAARRPGRSRAGRPRRAPGTGPCATPDGPAHPGAGQRGGESIAASRPGRGTRRSGRSRRPTAPSAPASTADAQGAAQLRAQRAAAACRSLPSSAPSAAGSPRAQRLISRSGSPAARRRAAVAEPVHSAYTAGVDSPPSASASTQWKRPRASTGVSRSPRPVPSAVPPMQRERDVAAQLGGQLEQLLAGQPGAPQRVAGDQGGGRVGAAAGHPAGDRDALAHVQVHRRLHAGVLGQQHARPARPGWCSSSGTSPAPSPRMPRLRSRAGVAVTSSYSETAWKTVTRSW